MTDLVFGRATPIHFMMLEFACWSDPAPDPKFNDWPALSRHEKVTAIVQGRANLFYLTEADFGFSLTAWRQFLIDRALSGGDDFGYGHPYAAGLVDREIELIAGTPERLLLENEAEALEGSIVLTPQFWWP